MEQRLINANKITDDEIDIYGWFDHEQIEDIHRMIDAQATVDAVPVVRCKECKNRKHCEIQWNIDDDFFCADGEGIEL